MRARHAEDGEDGVAHELLQQALVADDLLGQPVECAADHRLHDLRVLALGQRGGTDEIGEQGGGELALHAGRMRRRERRAACVAEAGVFRVISSA